MATPTTSIALQLYTLRDFLKTPAEVAKTLARVKQIGYDAVQCSGLGPIEPAELNRICRGEGLIVAATHESLDKLKNEPQKVIDAHRLLGCSYTAIGGLFLKSYTAADWENFVRDYNAIAKLYENSGVSIGYHNHSHELAHFDGKTALQILFEKLDPSVWMELDTYWLAHGGADPTVWLAKAKNRMPCVHLKDYGITPDRVPFFAEVGEGNLNWPAILQTCRDAGVKWYIIEQDVCPRDPFESIAISLRNLKAMGVS